MLWIKVVHILTIIAWMVGVFYLPRIFVHYVEGLEADEDVRRLKLMAKKLFRFMTLMSLFAIASGVWLWIGYGISGKWLSLKLLFVLGLLIYHKVCGLYLRRMQQDRLRLSSRYLRIFNEFPLLLLIAILICVVVKPL